MLMQLNRKGIELQDAIREAADSGAYCSDDTAKTLLAQISVTLKEIESDLDSILMAIMDVKE